MQVSLKKRSPSVGLQPRGRRREKTGYDYQYISILTQRKPQFLGVFKPNIDFLANLAHYFWVRNCKQQKSHDTIISDKRCHPSTHKDFTGDEGGEGLSYKILIAMEREEVLQIIRSAREQGEIPNLRQTDLRGINLSQADLHGIDFSGVDLNEANLYRADLAEAELHEAGLHNANLVRADLRGANLILADLRGANLRGAKLSEANLGYATLTEADLSGADFGYSNLRGADLTGAKLTETRFRGATMPDGTIQL